MPPTIEFRCPDCKSPLIAGENTYVCSSCARKWPVEDGVPIFGDMAKTPYWGEIPEEEMAQFLFYAREHGWKKAAQDFFQEPFPYLYQYITNESRSDWRYLLPLTSDSLVLDAGCGWGAISLALGEICKVVAMDYRPERMQFMNMRLREEQIDTITLACANVRETPFYPDYFDVVLFNGVLEWVAEGTMEHDPRKEQLIALQEAHRILKPGGTLYIGIENRIGYPYFFGKKDEHSGLRFATIAPRIVADAYSKIVRKRPYRTYTYGPRGYRVLLTKAGFSAPEIFIPIPNYRLPSYLLPYDHRGASEYYVKNLLIQASTRRVTLSHASKLLLTLGVWKHLAHSFCIIARKGSC